MSPTEQRKQRLIELLKELFQLDKPELDFGFYKVMHAKAGQITQFLENDLLAEIEQAFGDSKSDKVEEAKAAYEAAIAQAKSFGAPDPEAAPGVREAKAKYDAAKDGGNAEAEVYDHLYRFFERYYDGGDFLSRRYYARETDGRAAPYAVPYDGREVYLHWANKDQYYIKSSETLTNFSFDLAQAVEQEAVQQGNTSPGLDLSSEQAELKVHFKLVSAAEGEHGNIKASSDQKRFFQINTEQPIVLDGDELSIQFLYQPDPEKAGQDAKWQEKRLEEAVDLCLKALAEQQSEQATQFARLLSAPAPTEKQKERTLLGKYLQKYSARNTMDYFIHKDLGGFLKRELDFYIKNEVMRLDDIEQADAPAVESYLAFIKVMRRIAGKLITFLAQLENFQKKLWLKKKFVVETNYCITLDRVNEELYPEIAENQAQYEEWEQLFVISEIESDYEPNTLDWLKKNTNLVLDTKFFSSDFKDRLLSSAQDFDEQCDGLLVHSENFQALSLLKEKYSSSVKSIYADPPYNTSASEIIYKNGYKHSSWCSLLADRLELSADFLAKDGIICATIDDVEFRELHQILESKFGEKGILGVVPIRINPSGRPTEKGFALVHEYAIFAANSTDSRIYKMPRSQEQLARFNQEDSVGRYEERNLRREGSNSDRSDGERQYFPIFADLKTGNIRVPSMAWSEIDRQWQVKDELGERETEIWPITDEGAEKNWRWSEAKIRGDYSQVYARVPKSGIPQVYFKYRPNEDGVTPLTLWTDKSYSATEYGTKYLKDMLGKSLFSYPKSIHAVSDCLSIMGLKYKDDICLDFFAGSGTTGDAVINLSRDGTRRKSVLIEMGNHFQDVLRPRFLKSQYSPNWSKGKPINRNKSLSFITKYFSLESYEDALNNLQFDNDAQRSNALLESSELRESYMLNYLLDVETEGSASLLNIQQLADPTAYKMKIKHPGSDEVEEQVVDVMETFNYLIGLWVDHYAAPQHFTAEFEREVDADLPEAEQGQANARLKCVRMNEDPDGDYWFRLIEGYTLAVPADKTSKRSTLIIWRKLTSDPEKDNTVLEFFLGKLGISTREKVYDAIYVNGSHTLPNPVVDGEQTKVRQIEEAFHKAMFAEADA